MTVAWATASALPPDAVVRFAPDDDPPGGSGSDDPTDDAAWFSSSPVTSTAYTAQICLGEAMSVAPAMGANRHPAPVADLVRRANTSRWADPDAANYRVVKDPSDVIPPGWFTTPPWEKTLCLAYDNPDAQYQSPLLHFADVDYRAFDRRGFFRAFGGGKNDPPSGKTTPPARVRYHLPGDGPSWTGRSFRALPAPGSRPSRSAPLAFGVVGDTGQTEVTAAVLDHLVDLVDAAPDEGGAVSAILHAGDLSYADGYPPRWDSFGRLAEPLFSKAATLWTPGNHDVTLNGAEGLAARTRYPTPHASAGSASPDWWSLDVGLAHVVGISSYADADSPRSPMRAWLERDLAATDRARTPWLVVLFHAPWYNSNAGHRKEAERHREALEPLLFDHGVDVVINGHVHAYERTVGVRAGVPDQCGPTHLVVGDGGNYEGPYGGGWRAPQPNWSAFREGSFGAGRLEILDEKHATWEWRRTTCVAPAGTTALNETWYEPIGGGNSSRSCASVGDVSAQAMEPVDRVEIVRDVDACPNRGKGEGEKGAGKTARDSEPTGEEATGNGAAAGGKKRAPVDADAAGGPSPSAGAWAAATAFALIGWSATTAGLAWALVALHRERSRRGEETPEEGGRRRYRRVADDEDGAL